MTTTAQGTSIRCDAPNCTLPATIEEGVWGFCAAHAGKSKPETTRPRSTAHLSRAHTPAAVDLTHADTPVAASPPLVQVMGGGTIGLLLEQASGHSNRRVTTLAGKIEAQLEQLRELIATLAEDEKRKQAETAAKAAARAKVEKLEAELKAARAALRGKPLSGIPDTPPPDSQNGSATALPEGLRTHQPQPARPRRPRTSLHLREH